MKKKIDIKYSGIPNICFSLTNKGDDRDKIYAEQRKERGFDVSETWSLTDTIAKFIIPRLEVYQEESNKFLLRDPEVVKEIDEFLQAMKLIVRDRGNWCFSDEEEKLVDKGLENFPKIFMKLWW